MGWCICVSISEIPFHSEILNIYYLQESLSLALQVDSKICKFVSLCRFPS